LKKDKDLKQQHDIDSQQSAQLGSKIHVAYPFDPHGGADYELLGIQSKHIVSLQGLSQESNNQHTKRTQQKSDDSEENEAKTTEDLKLPAGEGAEDEINEKHSSIREHILDEHVFKQYGDVLNETNGTNPSVRKAAVGICTKESSQAVLDAIQNEINNLNNSSPPNCDSQSKLPGVPLHLMGLGET